MTVFFSIPPFCSSTKQNKSDPLIPLWALCLKFEPWPINLKICLLFGWAVNPQLINLLIFLLQIKSEDGHPLSGVLLSLSGGQFRSNLLTQDTGLLTFNNLVWIQPWIHKRPAVLLHLWARTGLKGIAAHIKYSLFCPQSPGQYYFKPMMKEFRFEPASQMITVEEGQNLSIDITGIKTAYR